jgi:microsomal dipeptidase-like Zn-dependent dipeptidase
LSRESDQGIEDVLRNIDHVVDAAGIEGVAVGTDALSGDQVGMHSRINLKK